MKTHTLKIWPAYYRALVEKRKTFEARKNDRGFEVGDRLLLCEYDPEAKPPREPYTGSSIMFDVTYVLDDPAYCAPGVVIMGLSFVSVHPAER